MKKRYILLILIILTGFSVTTLSSLEISAAFNIGNLAFDKAIAPTTDVFTTASYPWGISVYGNHMVSDVIEIDAGFFMDPILRNISYTLFTYREDYFSLGVGPFFGFFNSQGTPLKSGISTSIKLEWPGVVFVSFRTDSSIGGRLVTAGDYIQEKSDVSVGFYVPYAICSLNLNTKTYSQKTESGESVDSLQEYSFKTRIFQKNVPYNVNLSFGYQMLSKAIIDSTLDTTTNYTLNSIVIGTALDIQITDFLSWNINLDSNLYSFGMCGDTMMTLSSSNPLTYYFNLMTSVTVNADYFMNNNN